MKTEDISRSVYDPCVYIKKMDDEIFNLIILVVYVDDMLIWRWQMQELVEVCI